MKTWDKPWFFPYSTHWKPDFTGFVPGTIPGTKGGTESLCEKSLCAFFARYQGKKKTHINEIFSKTPYHCGQNYYKNVFSKPKDYKNNCFREFCCNNFGRDGTGPPDPQNPKTPSATKKKHPKTLKSSRVPKVKVISPKVNVIPPK